MAATLWPGGIFTRAVFEKILCQRRLLKECGRQSRASHGVHCVVGETLRPNASRGFECRQYF